MAGVPIHPMIAGVNKLHEDAMEILQKEVVKGWWQAEIVELLAGLSAPQSDFAPV